MPQRLDSNPVTRVQGPPLPDQEKSQRRSISLEARRLADLVGKPAAARYLRDLAHEVAA